MRCAITILAMATMTALALAWWVRWRFDVGVTAGAVILLIGAALSGSAVVAHRWFPDNRNVLDGVAWSAVPAVAGGTALAVPGPIGAAHVFVFCLISALSAAIVPGVTRRHVALCSATGALSLLGTLVAGTHEWLGLDPQRLGIMGLFALLVLVTASPTVALRLARIRPPYFGSITGRDMFRRADGMPADAVAPTSIEAGDEPGVDVTPAGREVTSAALRANGVLTGLCIAVALASPVTAWATLTPGGTHRGAAAALVLMFATIFISRARAFGDCRQAVALVLGAAAMLCVLAARSVTSIEGGSLASFLWSAAGLAAFGAAGMAAALLVPVTRFTPLVRMVAEWIELAVIVIALPFAAWMSGLFAWVRLR